MKKIIIIATAFIMALSFTTSNVVAKGTQNKSMYQQFNQGVGNSFNSKIVSKFEKNFYTYKNGYVRKGTEGMEKIYVKKVENDFLNIRKELLVMKGNKPLLYMNQLIYNEKHRKIVLIKSVYEVTGNQNKKLISKRTTTYTK